MRIVLLLTALLSHNAVAACFVAEYFEGATNSSVDGYKDGQDGLPGKFQITIDGDFASVVPDSGTSCLAMSEFIVVCSGGIDGRVTNLEIYSIDERQKKVVYAQVRNGLQAALLSDLNGGKLFVGEITGTCNN